MTRRRAIWWPSKIPLQRRIEGLTGYVLDFEMQEPSGDVALATNVAVALGRDVATLTYAAYVAGANWANSSGQIARHTAGSTATIQQDDIIAAGKTWEYLIVMSNRTAGSVSVTGGDAPVSANGSTTVTITATGADVIITPTSDFDGDIDLAQGTVKQTNIAVSSAYPGADVIVNGNFATDSDWVKGVGVTIAGGVLAHSGAAADTSTHQTDALTVGLMYKIAWDVINHTQGQTRVGAGFGNTGSFHDGAGSFTSVLQCVGNGNAFIKSGFTAILDVDNVAFAEANPLNLTNTGMSVAQSGAGNVPLVYSGDGVTSRLTFATITEYNSIIDMDNGGKMIFAKSDTWAAGIDVLWRSAVDANNEIVIYRDGTDLKVEYRETSTSSIVTIPSGSPTGFFTLGMDWNVVGDGVRGFYNSAQSGAAVAIAAAINGNLDVDECAIFAADSAGANSWAGDGGYPTLLNSTPTPADHAAYHTASGI